MSAPTPSSSLCTDLHSNNQKKAQQCPDARTRCQIVRRSIFAKKKPPLSTIFIFTNTFLFFCIPDPISSLGLEKTFKRSSAKANFYYQITILIPSRRSFPPWPAFLHTLAVLRYPFLCQSLSFWRYSVLGDLLDVTDFA